MRFRWVAIAFAAWEVYTAFIGKYWSTITSRFYETLSEPDMIYGVVGPQPIMLLGFVILMVLFFYFLVKYYSEEYYSEESLKGGDNRWK